MLGPRNASKVTRPPFPLIGGWGLGTRLGAGVTFTKVCEGPPTHLTEEFTPFSLSSVVQSVVEYLNENVPHEEV